jgi:hypothetical protein
MAGIRKTWDKAEFEARAIARVERGGEDEEDPASSKRKRLAVEAREEFRMAAPGLWTASLGEDRNKQFCCRCCWAHWITAGFYSGAAR